MKHHFLFVLLSLWATLSSATGDEIQISILTCGPGNTIEAIYGHNAIRVKDNIRQTDIAYNYGTFDFDTPGFAVKFMRGQLPYKISASRYEDFLYYYNDVGRSVTEQLLELDSLEKTNIISFLNYNMLPENREYMYDFFMDNCATRIRDVLEDQIEGLQWAVSYSSGKTFRQIIKEYQKYLPWTDLGIDLIIGAGADQITDIREETFIPDYLSTAISRVETSHSGSPLEKSKNRVIDIAQQIPEISLIQTPLFLFILLLLIEFNLFFRGLNKRISPLIKKYDTVWIIVLTLCSFIMIFMWWGTNHIHTKQNWNILWASPLLPLWYFGKNKLGKSKDYIFYIISILTALSLINSLPFVSILPQYFNPIVALICAIIFLKLFRCRNEHIQNYNPLKYE